MEKVLVDARQSASFLIGVENHLLFGLEYGNIGLEPRKLF